jgi:DNA-directed RNA polymerase subunit H (RpoH/RPB5)
MMPKRAAAPAPGASESAEIDRILKEDEKVDLLKRYHVSDPEEVLPSIDSQDPMVKWIGGAPGDVIEVLRHSDVAGSVPYYRYCVEDANVQ